MERDEFDGLKIASPCAVSWDAMEGDARVRFCGACRLNVYDLSGLSRAEARALVARREGRLCVRFFRRADGRVLTSDCPVGLTAARRRLRRLAGALAGVLGLAALSARLLRERAAPEPLMGKPSAQAFMGDVMPPAPSRP